MSAYRIYDTACAAIEVRVSAPRPQSVKEKATICRYSGLRGSGRKRSRMAWLVHWGLRVLAPCILMSVGTALAEDSELANLSESPQVSEPQQPTLSDSPNVYSSGINPAQDLPPAIATEHPVLPAPRQAAINSSFDASSVGTAFAQDSPPPIVAKNPIIPQHIALSSYADADSLGNRT